MTKLIWAEIDLDELRQFKVCGAVLSLAMCGLLPIVIQIALPFLCLSKRKKVFFSKLTAGDIKEIFTVIWSFDRLAPTEASLTLLKLAAYFRTCPWTGNENPPTIAEFWETKKGSPMQCIFYLGKGHTFAYLGRVRYRAPHSANNVKLSFACWFRWEETCSRRLKMQRKSGRKVWKLFATFAIWQTLRLQAKAIDATFLSTLFLPTNFGH